MEAPKSLFKRKIPSFVFEGALVLTAILSAVPAPDWLASLSMGGVFGPWLYLVCVTVIVVLGVRARLREAAEQRNASHAAATQANEQHTTTQNSLSQVIQSQQEVMRSQGELLRAVQAIQTAHAAIGATGPIGTPLLRGLEATSSLLSSYYQPLEISTPPSLGTQGVTGAMGTTGPILPLTGTIMVPSPLLTGTLSTVTQFADQISANPPRTPADVNWAVVQLARSQREIERIKAMNAAAVAPTVKPPTPGSSPGLKSSPKKDA